MRWSKDVDFICPIGPGYRRLRQIVSENNFKPSALFAQTEALHFPRDLIANQYGVRFAVISRGTPIKFEIVAEARIALEPPENRDWLNVPCLSPVDRYAEKLLANADRWPDSSIESRDLIDLAILRLHGEQSQLAIDKAEEAYPVITPLKKSLEKFQGSKDYRHKCFSALEIKNRGHIVNGIDLLASDLGLEKTDRAHDERSES
ncbi:nucleotidyl transferase AbiEii/AbiGii toxin family protein [Marinobacteraceae bacterium S3BR75-40.1]